MFAEAAEAADVVARQLAANQAAVEHLGEELRRSPPRAVVTCARGSSDHAATFAKYLIETRAGVLTASAGPSIASLYGVSPDLDQMLAIAISQSGRSPDILATAEAAKQSGARLVTLVNDTSSPLGELADLMVPLHAGAERSVAATKSYIASLSALLQIVSAWTQDREMSKALEAAPALLKQSWELDWSELAGALTDAEGLYVIGRGLGFGVAQEAALKFKETCGLHAEAFSAAEVRHGPLALAKPGFPVLVFRQSDVTEDSVDSLVERLLTQGCRVYITGSAPDGATSLPAFDAHPAIEPMLQVQSFYRAVNLLALRRGYEPDEPPHLAKVTETL